MKRQRGLAFTLISFILAILVVSMVAMALLARFRTTRLVLDQMENNKKLLLSSLDWAISPLIQSEDYGSIQRLLENIGSSPAVDVVRLIDNDYSTISSSRPGEVGILNEVPLVKRILDGMLFSTNAEEEEKEVAFAVPVRGEAYNAYAKSDVAAVLVITANVQYYQQLYTPILTSIAHAAITLATILSIFSYLFIRKTVIGPLGKLMNAIEEVECGHTDPEISIAQPFEFSRFAQMFTMMLAEIREKNNALKAYSDGLERKVADRTRELRETLRNLKLAQKTIIHQERMASIGNLSAGVAHEINNPTGFVIGNLSTLREYVDAIKRYYTEANNLLSAMKAQSAEMPMNSCLDRLQKIDAIRDNEDMDYIIDDLEPLLDEMDRGTSRIKNIVQDLRDYAREDNNAFDKADINAGLENALRIVWSKLKYKVEVTKELGDLPLVTCNLHHLEQVFVNILVNAADAMQGEGKITIVTRDTGTHAEISIADNGVGMSPDVLKHIFDPFYTTKDVGKGTGLGLSISHGIINNHGGEIEVESEEGRGSRFVIQIPIDQDKEA